MPTLPHPDAGARLACPHCRRGPLIRVEQIVYEQRLSARGGIESVKRPPREFGEPPSKALASDRVICEICGSAWWVREFPMIWGIEQLLMIEPARPAHKGRP